jgi:hypothetical protein
MRGTLYVCVSNGTNVKYGGPDESQCDPRHDTIVKVYGEVVNPSQDDGT